MDFPFFNLIIILFFVGVFILPVIKRVFDDGDEEVGFVLIVSIVLAVIFLPSMISVIFGDGDNSSGTYFNPFVSDEDHGKCLSYKTMNCEDEGINISLCSVRTEIQGPYYDEKEVKIYEMEVCDEWER